MGSGLIGTLNNILSSSEANVKSKLTWDGWGFDGDDVDDDAAVAVAFSLIGHALFKFLAIPGYCSYSVIYGNVHNLGIVPTP